MSETINIILIGKTGNGKSATGNTLLGKKVFLSKLSANAVTDTCSVQLANSPALEYRLIDTPGLFDTTSIAKRAIEIQRSVACCTEPHAFLLIMDATKRVGPEDLCTIEMLKMIFGESVVNHMIVIFTHGDAFSSDEEFEEFWKQTPEYVNLIHDCGNRVCRIENTHPLSQTNFWQHPIYAMIEELSNKGTVAYAYEYSKQHVLAFQHHIDTYDGNMDAIAQIQSMITDIDGRVQAENERREEEARKQQQKLMKLQEDMKKQQEEAKKREDEAKAKEQDARQRETEARKWEEEARKQQEIAIQREKEAIKRAENLLNEERRQFQAMKEEVKQAEQQRRAWKEDRWRYREEERRKAEQRWCSIQ